MEIWARIKDFPNYAVSTFGRVMSLKKNLILKQGWYPNRGYKHVSLCRDGAAYTTSVHTLVARHHLSNPNLLPEVNHISGFDNFVTNLEWRSEAGNRQHRTLNMLAGDGIHWETSRQKWHVTHSVNGKRIFGGRYDTFAGAQAARIEFLMSLKAIV